MRGLDEVVVLQDGMLDQRRIGPRDHLVPLGVGIPPVAGKKGELAGQGA
jgi:hypothetical protein